MLHSCLRIHEIYLCIHAIGVPEEVMFLEFEGIHPEEEQEQPEEPEVPAGEGVPEDKLPECPDHCPSSCPSSFLKGKHWCMLTQLFYIYL
jgi:hypothetical protein